MRIVHVTQHFIPSLGYQEYYLAREQIRAGHEVHVVTSNVMWSAGPYSALAAGGAARVTGSGYALEFGIPTWRLPVKWGLKGRPILEALGETVGSLRPDVVHAHSYLTPSTFIVAALRRRRVFRFVVDEHQLPYQARRGAFHVYQRRATAALARRFVMPHVDEFVAVASGARDWLVGEYGVPRARVRLIPLGADVELFRPDAEAGSGFRRSLHIENDVKVVAYTGKIAKHKRIDLVVKALSGVSKVIFVVVGHGDRATVNALQTLAEELGVRVHITGPVAHAALPGVLNGSDLCVWPADCTISHLEAAACGKPIIIPDEKGIADRVQEGNGFAVRTGDVAGLQAALVALLRDDEKRIRMGEIGRWVVVNRYSWGRIAREFDCAYVGGSVLV